MTAVANEPGTVAIMDALTEKITSLETDIQQLNLTIQLAQVERAGMQAALAQCKTLARSAPDRRELLQEAIVRVMIAAGGDLTHAQILELLRDDETPVSSDNSVRTMVNRLAQPGGSLHHVRRGVYRVV